MATALHDERLDVVLDHVLASGARSVVDLGCGTGEMIIRLAGQTQFTRIVGIDIATDALAQARGLLDGLAAGADDTRIALMQASFTAADERLCGFDAALLIETIEHIDPGRLSRVERAVFGCFRPATAFITTPNREYNVLHGVLPGAFRHPDHRFEWDRPKFRRWASGLAGRNGYTVTFVDIGEYDSIRGASTQMAQLRRRD